MMISIFLETQCTSMTFTSCKKSVGIFTHFSRADATKRQGLSENMFFHEILYRSNSKAAEGSSHYKKLMFQEGKAKSLVLAVSQDAQRKTKAHRAYRWHGDSNHIRKRTGMDGQAAGRRISLHTHSHTHTHTLHTRTHTPHTRTEGTPIASTVPEIINHQVRGEVLKRQLYSVHQRSCNMVCGSCTV